MIEKLDVLKQQGAHEYDPVRFCFIESLAHRASEQRDKVRELLEKKAQRTLDDYRLKYSLSPINIDGVKQKAPPVLEVKSEQEEKKQVEQENIPQVITALIALRKILTGDAENIQQGEKQGGSADAIENFSQLLVEQDKQMQQQDKSVSSDLTSLSESRLKSSVVYQKFQHQKRIDHFIDNALNETPENPGPLNPEILAVRLLKQINELSPEYISRYVGYFETLQWLEQEIRPSKVKS
ncbi:MAG: hypothetical protein ACJA2B_000892 [Candidatus Endobugula sp.]|jgi:hypothetical protein